MLIVYILLCVWLGVAVPYWLYALYASIQTVRKVPRLCDMEAPRVDAASHVDAASRRVGKTRDAAWTPRLHQGPADWPRLSVVVAARNEEDSMAAASGSLLEQDYPNFQLVLVDDRSEDRTGEIVDELARRDGRVVAVHVRELPAGWLGKVHALTLGMLLALEWAPWGALLGGGTWAAVGGGLWAWAMLAGGAVMLGCAIGGTAAAGKWAGIPLRAILYWPAAVAVMAAGMIRMTGMGVRRGGVQWRDTFYTCDELRRNRRVKL